MPDPSSVAAPPEAVLPGGSAPFLLTRRRSRLARRIALEGAGLGVVLVATLVALAHLALSARSTVFFDNGDSVLMPLIARSLADGGHPTWMMSSVLFLFPEAPTYLAISALVPEVHAALLTNAVVIVVALYLLLRALAAAAAPHLRPRARVAAATLPVLVLMALTFLEHTADRSTFELVTLFLTTTYYYGTTLALVAATALVLLAARQPRSARPLVGLGAVTAVSTLSNPLFLIWAVGPILVALALGTRFGVVARRTALRVGAVAVGSAALGYLARLPLSRYIAADIATYLRPDKTLHSIGYFIGDYFRTAFTLQGAAEMTLLATALCGTLALTVIAIVRRWPAATALGLLMASSTIVLTTLAAVLLGTTATRYLMPLFFGPTIAAVVVGLHVLNRHPVTLRLALDPLRARWAARPALGRRVVAGAVAVALVAGGTAVQLVATAPSTRTSADARCVANWVGGRDITGAGRFWTVRGLQTYGSSSVRLLQVTTTFGAAFWLNDVSQYQGQTISYLVVSKADDYSIAPGRALGSPVATVACGQYTILDYTGTIGQEILTQHVGASAREQLEARGLES